MVLFYLIYIHCVPEAYINSLDFSIISCLKIEVIKSLSNRFRLKIHIAFIAK